MIPAEHLHDLIVEDDEGVIQMFKASTVPSDPGHKASSTLRRSPRQIWVFRCRCSSVAAELLVHRTNAINTIITGRVAGTALLTGRLDILMCRH